MIIELEINGARVIISGDNLSVNVTQEVEVQPIAFRSRPSDLSVPTPDQIKSLRKSLGQSQQKFGKRLGVTQASVCRWELGYEKPGGSSAILIRSMIDGAAA